MKSSFKIPTWLLIFLLAYILRLAYVVEISDRPYFTAPAVDAQYHDDWAQDIARGKIQQDQPFFRAPLYPFFLGAIYYIFGHDYFIIRIIQALLDSFTCVLIYFLGRKLFSPRVGTISGFVAAFTGILIYFEAELLLPVLILPLNLGLMLLLFKALENERKIYWWLSGLLFGLSVITRPDIAILAPLLLFIFFRYKKANAETNAKIFNQGKNKVSRNKIKEIKKQRFFTSFRMTKSNVSIGLKRGVLFALGVIIPIIPVTYHNIRAGEFVLIATQGGVNFYIGNNPQSDGATASFPGLGNIWRFEDAVVEAENESGRKLTPAQVSGFYYRKGLHFITQQPLQWLKLTGNKILLYFSRVEISNNKNIYFAAQDSFILNALLNYVGFWLYGPLGILGLGIFYRKSIVTKIVTWFVILYSAVVIMFFVCARFRLPIVPFLIIFAVAAVEWFIMEIKQAKYKKLITPVIALAILVPLVNINILHIQKIAPAYAHFSLGNAYHKKGRYDLAKEEYLKAIAADPYYPQVHLNLGVIYYENRQDEAAEKEFLKEIEINHGFESAYAFNDLGNVRVRQGRLKDAISFYQEALRIYPNYPDARINITRTYSDLGLLKVSQDSLEIALEYLGKAVELNPQEPMYRYNYGLVLGALGEEEEAINQMRRVLELDPNFKPALQVMENYDKLQKENYRKNN